MVPHFLPETDESQSNGCFETGNGRTVDRRFGDKKERRSNSTEYRPSTLLTMTAKLRARQPLEQEYGFVRIALIILTLAGIFAQFSQTLEAKNADLSSSIVNLSESSADTAPGYADESPEIVTEGDNVHVFWFARHPGGGHKICHRRSPDRGKTWLPTYEFYQQDLAMRDPIASNLNKHMAVINGTVHIAFGAYGGEGADGLGRWSTCARRIMVRRLKILARCGRLKVPGMLTMFVSQLLTVSLRYRIGSRPIGTITCKLMF